MGPWFNRISVFVGRDTIMLILSPLDSILLWQLMQLDSNWNSLTPLYQEYSKRFTCIRQLSSVAQLCLTLCDPMNCSMPGFSVYHYLPEFAQTHVYWVSDAIQTSHPLLPPAPLVISFPSIRVFSSESALHIRWPNYWTWASASVLPMNS